MSDTEPELWKAKVQAKRGLSIPVEVMELWGLPKDARPTVYFTVDQSGRVIVMPAKDLKSYFTES